MANNEDFKDRIQALFPDYDFSETMYINDSVPIKVLCKKHGAFFIAPSVLIFERKGCPYCWKTQSNNEKSVRKVLEENSIYFEQEKPMPGMVFQKPLYFDFWIPDYNTAIEYQGLQHFAPVEFFGGLPAFQEQVQRDNVKREYCRINKIRLLEVKYYENIEEQLSELLEEHRQNYLFGGY